MGNRDGNNVNFQFRKESVRSTFTVYSSDESPLSGLSRL